MKVLLATLTVLAFTQGAPAQGATQWEKLVMASLVTVGFLLLLLPFAVDPVLAVAQSLLWETVLVALGLTAGAASLWLGRAADRRPSAVAGDVG